jgi:hypothetical protein
MNKIEKKREQEIGLYGPRMRTLGFQEWVVIN